MVLVNFAALNQSLDASAVLRALELHCVSIGVYQWRGRCPFHASQSGKTLSVSLTRRKFLCHAARCGRHGDLIDLWAGVRGLTLRAAALELAERFR